MSGPGNWDLPSLFGWAWKSMSNGQGLFPYASNALAKKKKKAKGRVAEVSLIGQCRALIPRFGASGEWVRGIAPPAVGGQCRPKGGGKGRCKDGEQKKKKKARVFSSARSCRHLSLALFLSVLLSLSPPPTLYLFPSRPEAPACKLVCCLLPPRVVKTRGRQLLAFSLLNQ